MARLIASAIASLDGYTVDAAGSFDWAAPAEDLHRFVNDLERPIGTYLYGRRMYETMRFWGTQAATDDPSAVIREYAAVWQAADKVVYSSTLDEPSTPSTRIVRSFNAAEVRALVDAADRDVSVGGSTLAGEAMRAGLVDEIHLFSVPVVVGGGTAFFPVGLRMNLELVATDRFADGAVHLHYRVMS